MRQNRLFGQTLATPFLLYCLLCACSPSVNQTAKTDFLRQDMDTTVNPGNDFFDYANGGWIKKNPIPAAESSWGIGNLVQDEIFAKLKKINEDAMADKSAAAGSVTQKIGDFWYSGMDSAGIEQQGIQPLTPEMTRIDSIRDRAGLLDEIAHLQTIGVDNAFSAYVTQDDKNSAKMAFRLDQGGLGMPNRDYYFNTDSRTATVRAEYRQHLTRMFELMGDDSVTAQKESDAVMQLETSLAKSSRKLADLRDPYANYHKMAVPALNKLTPAIHWQDMLTKMNILHLDSAIVGQPEFYKALEQQLDTASLNTWKAYLRYHLITSFAGALSSKFDLENFHFYHTILTGVKEQQPRWKRILRMEEGTMGEMLGQLFVKNYFPPEEKKRYSGLVTAMMASFKQHIEELDWMSDSTKKYALYKLSRITPKVGYPDKWKDFSALRINRGPLVQNLMRGNEWWYHFMIGKLGKPVDRTEWDMTPQTYNAYYNPSNNEIVLPAAIFTIAGLPDSLADDAIIYGYAGASTIGHEMTHGFDDQGRLYDADGNLHNWWTKEDAAKFDQRADLMVKQFDAYKVLDSLHINGRACLGENIADLGGIVIGIDAFKKTDEYKKGEKIAGLTPMQRYFLGYALGWMEHDRKELLLRQILTDVHAPAKYRVNGPMSDIPEFYEAFNVRPGQPMWRPDSLRVKIW